MVPANPRRQHCLPGATWIGKGAPVYMAAVLEYLSAEPLESTGNASQDNEEKAKDKVKEGEEEEEEKALEPSWLALARGSEKIETTQGFSKSKWQCLEIYKLHSVVGKFWLSRLPQKVIPKVNLFGQRWYDCPKATLLCSREARPPSSM